MRYADGIDLDKLPAPNIEQARLPVPGVEPNEQKPELKPMRSYQEMPASRWTSPTDR